MKKKIDLTKITSEEISRDIDKAFQGEDAVMSAEKNQLSKIFTFVLLFFIYIFFSITIKDYAKRIMVITFGLIGLLILFQIYIIHPAMKKANRRRLG